MTRDGGGSGSIQVDPQALEHVSGYLDGVAKDLAKLRDGFNDVCNPPSKTLEAHGGDTGIAFDDMFGAWWTALDNMAGSNAAFADATQQAAVIYEHVDRKAIQLPPGPPLTDAQKEARKRATDMVHYPVA